MVAKVELPAPQEGRPAPEDAAAAAFKQEESAGAAGIEGKVGGEGTPRRATARGLQLELLDCIIGLRRCFLAGAALLCA